MDLPTSATFKEVLCVIKCVLHTKEYGLKVYPTKSVDKIRELVCFSDSNYAGDPNTHKSAAGYVLCMKEVPVCCKPKTRHGVTLSSTEAKWIALLEVTKEIIFVPQLLESLGIKVNLPIIVRIDNIRAIFMSKNINPTSGTQHVDVHTKYVNQYCKDEIINVILIKLADNYAGIITKKLNQEFCNKNSSKLC